jgi:hypothetical protein
MLKDIIFPLGCNNPVDIRGGVMGGSCSGANLLYVLSDDGSSRWHGTVLQKMIFPTGQHKARVPISHWHTLAQKPKTLDFG